MSTELFGMGCTEGSAVSPSTAASCGADRRPDSLAAAGRLVGGGVGGVGDVLGDGPGPEVGLGLGFGLGLGLGLGLGVRLGAGAAPPPASLSDDPPPQAASRHDSTTIHRARGMTMTDIQIGSRWYRTRPGPLTGGRDQPRW